MAKVAFFPQTVKNDRTNDIQMSKNANFTTLKSYL